MVTGECQTMLLTGRCRGIQGFFTGALPSEEEEKEKEEEEEVEEEKEKERDIFLLSVQGKISSQCFLLTVGAESEMERQCGTEPLRTHICHLRKSVSLINSVFAQICFGDPKLGRSHPQSLEVISF